MNLEDLHRVWEIKALKKPGEDEAKKFLEKIAKQVQPIMRKRKWRVKLLSEFCPNSPALLGLNVGGGVHVKLRLRRPNRDWDFFPFDQVLDTMLHELCHNVHGPHNASFYNLWDELRKEGEDLISKGITGTGEGFDLPGRRLGGFSRQPPPSSLRKTAVAAAEKRAKLGSLLPSGPKRLGGDSTIMGALSPIQAAAMAAERRLQDEVWCGSQSAEAVGDDESGADIAADVTRSSVVYSSRKRNRESNKAATSLSANGHSGSNSADLSTDASTLGSILDHGSSPKKRTCNSYKNCCDSRMNSEARFVDLTNNQAPGSAPNNDATNYPVEPAMWECGMCTLFNPPLAPICGLCSTEKPKDVGAKYKTWPCRFCTLENSVKSDKCSACDQWRYSYGQPVSTPAPNVGT